MFGVTSVFSLKFLEFILESNTYVNIAKLLIQPSTHNSYTIKQSYMVLSIDVKTASKILILFLSNTKNF